ncbi:unnamed protein product [Spirodela intermedia]|uniref:Disease resistance protein winged helix domain-containing protein n=1 Tax=Spirodela intermedia TaxID=51605 RepID=A0ABN7E7Q7_SPIIN|nr:unnamed protein product [Spirodela intermedia]
MTCGTPTAGETLEETAEDYLEELVQRCMVILVRDLPELRCRIHDVLHDFTVAEAKEVGFLVCHVSETTEAPPHWIPPCGAFLFRGIKRRTGTRRPPQVCAPC